MSLDHLVRPEEEGLGDLQAQGLSGREVDPQFEHGGLPHAEIGRAPENNTTWASLSLSGRPKARIASPPPPVQLRSLWVSLLCVAGIPFPRPSGSDTISVACNPSAHHAAAVDRAGRGAPAPAKLLPVRGLRGADVAPAGERGPAGRSRGGRAGAALLAEHLPGAPTAACSPPASWPARRCW
jgi:hypothetical protein